MEHTSNYNLSQWAGEDRILREAFNTDNAKIEAALANAGNCKIATGSYAGTGKRGSSNPCKLSFPFVPKIVFITQKTGSSNGNRATLIHGCTAAQSTDYLAYGITSVTWNDTNKSVSWYSTDGNESQAISAQMNQSGTTYLYVALG